MRFGTLLSLTGMGLNLLHEVRSGGGGALGDALRDIFASTGKKLDATPATRRFHEVTTVEQRIKHIKGLIQRFRYDPKVREIALKILAKKNSNGKWKVPEKDWHGEVRALYDAWLNNVRYARDPYGMDTYTAVLRTLTQYHGADCDCTTIGLGTLLQSVGYPIKLKVIQTTGNDTWNHIYLLVGMPPNDPKKWLPADPTSGRELGYQAPKGMILKKKYFDVD
jgi:hypothetical protein